MKKRKFVTALNCMDGRAQLPVIRYLTRKYRAAFVDMVTEAGIVSSVLRSSAGKTFVKKHLQISVKKHRSRHIALVAHHDCAGNRVSKQKQIGQLKAGVSKLKARYKGIHVIGLWLGPDWKVRRIV